MIIYKYTNKINEKKYIGQTIRSFDLRHYEHLKGSTTYFDRALAKYGEDNFEWEILYEAKDVDELNEKEIEFIAKYDSLKPNGYNITLGGNSFSGYSHSKETRRKISKGIKEFYRKNPDKLPRGKSSASYGVNWSDEQKEEMSRIKREFWKDNDEAKEEMSRIKKAHFRDNPELRELKSRQAKEWIAKNGHHFEEKRHTEESKRKMSEALKGRVISEEWREKISKNHARKRKVINIDTGEVFNTIKSASESVRRNKSGISNTCRGAQETCGGYRWAYLDEYLSGNKIRQKQAKEGEEGIE